MMGLVLNCDRGHWHYWAGLAMEIRGLQLKTGGGGRPAGVSTMWWLTIHVANPVRHWRCVSGLRGMEDKDRVTGSVILDIPCQRLY